MIDAEGTAIVRVTAEDEISTEQRMDVSFLSQDADRYVLEIESEVAEQLSGEGGEGVRFMGGAAQVDLSGTNLTGEDVSITIAEPDAVETRRSKTAAEKLNAEIVTPGVTVTMTGTDGEPGDRATVRLEIPAGVDTEEITAMVYIDEYGNYTNIPWKLEVAGSTAYVVCELPDSGTLVPMSSAVTFTDVKDSYWGAEAIEKAAGMMLIRGYTDGTFRPANNVTRAEFATVMLRASGLLTENGTTTVYKDVQKSDWYYDAISIATALNVMNGYTDGTARPNNHVTRVEGMVIASRLLKLEKLCGDISDEEVEEILGVFADSASVPVWARKDVALCVQSGIIVGSNGMLLPADNLTRVQAAIIATRLSELIVKAM